MRKKKLSSNRVTQADQLRAKMRELAFHNWVIWLKWPFLLSFFRFSYIMKFDDHTREGDISRAKLIHAFASVLWFPRHLPVSEPTNCFFLLTFHSSGRETCTVFQWMGLVRNMRRSSHPDRMQFQLDSLENQQQWRTTDHYLCLKEQLLK